MLWDFNAGWSPKSLDLGAKKSNDLKKLLTPKSKDLGLQATNLFFKGIIDSSRLQICFSEA